MVGFLGASQFGGRPLRDRRSCGFRLGDFCQLSSLHPDDFRIEDIIGPQRHRTCLHCERHRLLGQFACLYRAGERICRWADGSENGRNGRGLSLEFCQPAVPDFCAFGVAVVTPFRN